MGLGLDRRGGHHRTGLAAGYGDNDPFMKSGGRNCSVTDRLIRLRTALVILMVASATAIISHRTPAMSSRQRVGQG
jgi:hypothetical protein